jgi:hypothetical protein
MSALREGSAVASIGGRPAGAEGFRFLGRRTRSAADGVAAAVRLRACRTVPGRTACSERPNPRTSPHVRKLPFLKPRFRPYRVATRVRSGCHKVTNRPHPAGSFSYSKLAGHSGTAGLARPADASTVPPQFPAVPQKKDSSPPTNRVGGSVSAPVLPHHRTYSSYPAVSVNVVTANTFPADSPGLEP